MFNVQVVKHQDLHSQMLACYLHDYPKVHPVTDWRLVAEEINDRKVYEQQSSK